MIRVDEPKRSRDMQIELVDGRRPAFPYRQNLCVVTNVSWGMLPWEADLLVLRNSGWLEEVEIKVSAADWRADRAKLKFMKDPLPHGLIAKSWQRIHRFWYAAPMTLAKRFAEMGIPDWAGVVGVNSAGCEVLREAEKRADSRKLDDKEACKLCRLGAMRQWDLMRQLNAKQEVGPDGPIPGALALAAELAEAVPQ